MKKTNVIIIVILIINILISAANTRLILLYKNSDTVSETENVPVINTVEDTDNETEKDICPANEYGNHNWEPATCQLPSKCIECGAYKDSKLGNHRWVYDVCEVCGASYE